MGKIPMASTATNNGTKQSQNDFMPERPFRCVFSRPTKNARRLRYALPPLSYGGALLCAPAAFRGTSPVLQTTIFQRPVHIRIFMVHPEFAYFQLFRCLILLTVIPSEAGMTELTNSSGFRLPPEGRARAGFRLPPESWNWP